MDFFVDLFVELFLPVTAELVFAFLVGFHETIGFLALAPFTLVGCLCGGLSALLLSAPVIDVPMLRLLNLGVTPLIAGAVMVAFAAYRRSKGQPHVTPGAGFVYGFSFALAFVVTRFFALGLA